MPSVPDASTPSSPRISVIICTRNRTVSLRETLRCLACADRSGLEVDVIVVDNGDDGNGTRQVVAFAAAELTIQHLVERRVGKGFALNRALNDANRLGDIIAVLDDDMSPEIGWFRGVQAICDRWPNMTFFTGRSHVIWPDMDLPPWILRPSLLGWAFSVMGPGQKDQEVPPGRWFSGNHFWFRSQALEIVKEFEAGTTPPETHIQISEARFMLDLLEHGRRGVAGPDAVCGHRIQPQLVDFESLKKRAAQTGRGFADARLRPYRKTVRQAVLFRRHPVAARLYCWTQIVRWLVIWLGSFLPLSRPVRYVWRLTAVERIATHQEYLRVAGTMPEYRWSYRNA